MTQGADQRRTGGSSKVVGKAEQSRRTRRLIVETATRCLAEYGYARTNLILIAKEAGLSRGPLHYHFRDIYEVMGAVARVLPLGAAEEVISTLSAQTSAAARIDALINIAVREHAGNHHFVAMELLLAARNDPLLHAAITPHLGLSENLIDDWWAEYLEILRWPKPRLIAFRRLFVACLRGLALDQVLQDDAGAHAEALLLFRDIFTQAALSPKA